MRYNLFGTTSYRIFDRSVLGTVIVDYKYPLVETERFISALSEFVKTYWRIDALPEPKDGVYQFALNDNRVKFAISNSSASIDISCSKYMCFGNDVVPQVYALRTLLCDVMGIKALEMISLRKINYWIFEVNKCKDINPRDFRNSFFSRPFLDLPSTDAYSDDKCIDFMVHRVDSDDNDGRVIIKSGLLHKDGPDSVKYCMILDLKLECDMKGKDVKESDEELAAMNKQMFNVFMWCINDGVKQLMNNGKNDCTTNC